MERDDELGRSSQQGELGSSGGVDDAAWAIDWDRTRPARLVGGRDRHRANGVAAPEPPAARPHAPPPVADPIPAADRTPVPPLTPGRRRRSRPQRRTVALIVGAVLLLAAAAGAVAFLIAEDASDDALSSAAPAAPAQPAQPTQGSSAVGPSDRRREFAPRRAFVTGGVRFSVTSEPNQQWARDTLALPPGAGRAWHTVSVLYRNISRRSLTVEGLRFRLRDARGALYSPSTSTSAGNAGTELPPGAQIPAGTLVHGQLAFRVQEGSGPFALLIDASPSRRVRVEFAPG